MKIVMYVNPDELGVDSKYPEAFARFCEEQLAKKHPDADITVALGCDPDELPDDIDVADLWDEYCSLPAEEYTRLSDAVPADRRAGYLDGC